MIEKEKSAALKSQSATSDGRRDHFGDTPLDGYLTGRIACDYVALTARIDRVLDACGLIRGAYAQWVLIVRRALVVHYLRSSEE